MFMGYKIEVNYSTLGVAANEIDEYVDVIKKYMKKADDEIYRLTSNNWKNSDANTFKGKWIELSSSDSVTEHMKASLRNYANSLRYAQEQYRKAQSSAINASKSL